MSGLTEAERCILDSRLAPMVGGRANVLTKWLAPVIHEITAARVAAVERHIAEQVLALVEDVEATFIVPMPGSKFGRTRVVRVADVRAVLAEATR